MSPATTRVVGQGSGNVGGIAALLLHEAGFKVVGLSDVHGGIHDPRGIDVPAALKYLQARSEEHTSELQSHLNLVCRLLLEKKKQIRPSSDTSPNSSLDTAARNALRKADGRAD